MPANQKVEKTGAYIGYTQGGGITQKPTLYFAKGHLTQQHSVEGNACWHPNGAMHKAGNIKAEHVLWFMGKMDEYNKWVNLENDEKKNTPPDQKKLDEYEEKRNAADGEIAAFTSSFYHSTRYDATGSGPTTKLFEASSPDGIHFYDHISRGTLTKPGEPGFNTEFGEDYAHTQVNNATF